MTIKSYRNLSLPWHFGNGVLGAILASAATVIIIYILLLFQTDKSRFIGEYFSMPVLGVACCFTIAFLARRVARKLTPPSASQNHFTFGASFHVGNIVIALGLAFLLLLIPGIGIPFLNPSGSMASVLLLLSMAVILVLVHTVASMRAAKHIIKAYTSPVGQHNQHSDIPQNTANYREVSTGGKSEGPGGGDSIRAR